MATVDFSRLVPKAWVRFTGSGTVTIDDSENITSITDNGTGLYQIVIADDMANANYCHVANARDSSTTAIICGRNTVAAAAGTHDVACLNNSDGLIDPEEVCVAYFGDLA